MNQDREEAAAGSSRTEKRNTDIEDEGEGRTNKRNEICAGTSLMATHAYSIEEPREPSRKGDIYLRQWDTREHVRRPGSIIIIIIYFRREGRPTTYILPIVRTKETKQ